MNVNSKVGLSGSVTFALVSTVIAVALFVRLLASQRGWLWYDEYYSAVFATFPDLDDVLLAIQDIDYHPPLYYLQLRGWAAFSWSDSWLLGNSLAWSLVAMAGVYCSGTALLGQRAGVASLVLMALAPLAVSEASNLRMYAMLMGLASWLPFLIVSVFTRPSPWLWGVLITVSSAAISWSHGAGLLGLGCAGLLGVPYLLRKSSGWTQRIMFLMSLIVAAVISIPPLLDALERRPGHLKGSEVAEWGPIIDGLLPGLSLVALAVLLLGINGTWRTKAEAPGARCALLTPCVGVFGTLGVLWLIGQRVPVVHVRAVAFLLPVCCTAIGCAVATLIAGPSRVQRGLGWVGIVLLAFSSAAELYPLLDSPERSSANHKLARFIEKQELSTAIWAPRPGTAYSLCWELRDQATMVSVAGAHICTLKSASQKVSVYSGNRRDRSLHAPFRLVLKSKERIPRLSPREKLGKWKKLSGHRVANVSERSRERKSKKKR